jgi:hypothetical protein
MVAALALAGFGVAHAEDQPVLVRRSNPVGTVARDTLTGALVGSAVSGGIILYNMGIQGHDNYDWGRTLAWGAGAGAVVGLVWGIVDATTGPSYAAMRPAVRDGASSTFDLHRADLSRKSIFPLAMGHF